MTIPRKHYASRFSKIIVTPLSIPSLLELELVILPSHTGTGVSKHRSTWDEFMNFQDSLACIRANKWCEYIMIYLCTFFYVQNHTHKYMYHTDIQYIRMI